MVNRYGDNSKAWLLPSWLPWLALPLIALGTFLLTNREQQDFKSVSDSIKVNLVEYDGHLWIQFMSPQSVAPYSMAHHPDCPCGKSKLAEKE